jgi:hypothetical protein
MTEEFFKNKLTQGDEKIRNSSKLLPMALLQSEVRSAMPTF